MFFVPHFFCLAKRNGVPPKKSAFCLVRCNLTLAETLYVVIPKQDTYFSNADRSLSRLRGSPLPGAGCLGFSLAQAGLSGWLRQFKSLISRRCVFSAGRCCGGYAAGAHLGWLCRLGLGWVLGLCFALARLTCRVLLRRLCRRCAFGLAVPLGLRQGLEPWPRADMCFRLRPYLGAEAPAPSGPASGLLSMGG